MLNLRQSKYLLNDFKCQVIILGRSGGGKPKPPPFIMQLIIR